jgi:hypothetical protein
MERTPKAFGVARLVIRSGATRSPFGLPAYVTAWECIPFSLADHFAEVIDLNAARDRKRAIHPAVYADSPRSILDFRNRTSSPRQEAFDTSGMVLLHRCASLTRLRRSVSRCCHTLPITRSSTPGCFFGSIIIRRNTITSSLRRLFAFSTRRSGSKPDTAATTTSTGPCSSKGGKHHEKDWSNIVRSDYAGAFSVGRDDHDHGQRNGLRVLRHGHRKNLPQTAGSRVSQSRSAEEAGCY